MKSGSNLGRAWHRAVQAMKGPTYVTKIGERSARHQKLGLGEGRFSRAVRAGVRERNLERMAKNRARRERRKHERQEEEGRRQGLLTRRLLVHDETCDRDEDRTCAAGEEACVLCAGRGCRACNNSGREAEEVSL